MRAVLVLAVLLAATLAGCSAPPGVNEDTYPGYRYVEPPEDRRLSPEDETFFSAMREHARPRPVLANEAAYDRFLENATRWARDGIDDVDRARPLNESDAAVRASLIILETLAATHRGSDKEFLGQGPVRTALAVRHGLTSNESIGAASAEGLLASARAAVDEANASAHDARARLPSASRHALLRAEAVLGLAMVQLAGADAQLANFPDRPAAAAVDAIEARVTARTARFWLAEAERAGAGGGPPWTWPGDLAERTANVLADAEERLSAAADGPPSAVPIVREAAFALALVQTAARAGLPEGAWAQSQVLQESLLALDFAMAGRVPSPAEVKSAWEDARVGVRTFRDALRYDRALATVETDLRPFGDPGYRGDLLKAYGTIARLRAIGEERERVLAPPGEA